MKLPAGVLDLLKIATPGNPAAGLSRLYGKTDDALYTRTSLAVEQRLGPSLGVYGDGSDGVAAFDTVTAALAGVYARTGGNVYTLQRDCYFTTVTVTTGCVVVTNGYKLFANKSLTINSGCNVNNDGAAAVANAAGATANQNTAGTGSAGSAGVTGTAGVASANVASSIGARGGSGGAGPVLAGGAAGTVTAVTTAVGSPRNLLQAMSLQNIGALTRFTSGTGGGSGGGNATGTGVSGGGGGAGGVTPVYALAIVNNGTIQANGGAGGAATLGTSAGIGGGGGGGGGAVVVVSGSANNGTVQALAGAGGALAGTGFVGVAGSAGNVYWLVC